MIQDYTRSSKITQDFARLCEILHDRTRFQRIKLDCIGSCDFSIMQDCNCFIVIHFKSTFSDGIVQMQSDAMNLTNQIVQEQTEDMKQKLEGLSSKEMVI